MFTFLDKVSQVLKPKGMKQPVVAVKDVKQAKKPQIQHAQQPVQPKIDEKLLAKQLAVAQAQAREIIIEAKDEAFRIKQSTLSEIEKREQVLERRFDALEAQEQRIHTVREQSEKAYTDAQKVKQEQLDKLERVAQLTRDEARMQLLAAVEEKSKQEIARIIRESQERAKEDADKKAREILIDAMRHGATDYVAEFTISTVEVPDEEMKGRIIGKEGRNIKAFEEATGVDVDLDEEGIIRLSSFDSVRREIARVSLTKLLRDGRIQPIRIEEVVTQTKKEIERIMFEEGEKLCQRVGVFNLPRDIVSLLGRFKYRFSYGQNMITHTLEETKIGIALAHATGAEVNVVRLGCLLHDIGKVITEKEGNHIELGVEVLKKYNIPQLVIDCVAQHHEDTPFTSVESVLVYVSDAISGARPGARYEDVEQYIKRLTDLEAIAKGHKGVTEVYAFQAGRELRVIVRPDEVDDAAATIMAEKIKDEIEKKLTYPGNIRVTVIRELRATAIAK